MKSSLLYSILVILLIFCGQSSLAGGGSGPPDVSSKPKAKPQTKAQAQGIQEIKSVIKKYRTSKGIVMKVKKRILLSLLEQEKLTEGEMWLSGGKMRMELSGPEPVTLILNQKSVWVVEQLPKEFGGKLQVAKITLNGSKIKKSALLALFLGDENLWDEFELLKRSEAEKSFVYTLKPNMPDRVPGVAKVSLRLDKNFQYIKQLKYWDDLENETTYRFLKVQFDQKMDPKKFKYTPPKGAEITTY